eukprot:TRINITY_DN4837_c0_g1_i2.p1 TRINITY_DN4837_c0_g1~~TRINITY_DN4837_c0_g1_i2.p1  ORF type:complete len:2644 (-),score=628.31 TRINITY_DN4837_c0_g1_i2:511-7848(-)
MGNTTTRKITTSASRSQGRFKFGLNKLPKLVKLGKGGVISSSGKGINVRTFRPSSLLEVFSQLYLHTFIDNYPAISQKTRRVWLPRPEDADGAKRTKGRKKKRSDTSGQALNRDDLLGRILEELNWVAKEDLPFYPTKGLLIQFLRILKMLMKFGQVDPKENKIFPTTIAKEKTTNLEFSGSDNSEGTNRELTILEVLLNVLKQAVNYKPQKNDSSLVLAGTSVNKELNTLRQIKHEVCEIIGVIFDMATVEKLNYLIEKVENQNLLDDVSEDELEYKRKNLTRVLKYALKKELKNQEKLRNPNNQSLLGGGMNLLKGGVNAVVNDFTTKADFFSTEERVVVDRALWKENRVASSSGAFFSTTSVSDSAKIEFDKTIISMFESDQDLLESGVELLKRNHSHETEVTAAIKNLLIIIGDDAVETHKKVTDSTGSLIERTEKAVTEPAKAKTVLDSIIKELPFEPSELELSTTITSWGKANSSNDRKPSGIDYHTLMASGEINAISPTMDDKTKQRVQRSMVQRLYFNQDILDHLLFVLGQCLASYTDPSEAIDKNLEPMMRSTCDLLTRLLCKQPKHQEIVFKSLSTALVPYLHDSRVTEYVGPVVAAVFARNQELCRRVDVTLLKQLIDQMLSNPKRVLGSNTLSTSRRAKVTAIGNIEDAEEKVVRSVVSILTTLIYPFGYKLEGNANTPPLVQNQNLILKLIEISSGHIKSEMKNYLSSNSKRHQDIRITKASVYLVHLFALCADRKNYIAEKICQELLAFEDCMRIVDASAVREKKAAADGGIDGVGINEAEFAEENQIKAAYLKFTDEVYLNTALDSYDILQSNMDTKQIWYKHLINFIKREIRALEELLGISPSVPDEIINLDLDDDSSDEKEEKMSSDDSQKRLVKKGKKKAIRFADDTKTNSDGKGKQKRDDSDTESDSGDIGTVVLPSDKYLVYVLIPFLSNLYAGGFSPVNYTDQVGTVASGGSKIGGTTIGTVLSGVKATAASQESVLYLSAQQITRDLYQSLVKWENSLLGKPPPAKPDGQPEVIKPLVEVDPEDTLILVQKLRATLQNLPIIQEMEAREQQAREDEEESNPTAAVESQVHLPVLAGGMSANRVMNKMVADADYNKNLDTISSHSTAQSPINSPGEGNFSPHGKVQRIFDDEDLSDPDAEYDDEMEGFPLRRMLHSSVGEEQPTIAGDTIQAISRRKRTKQRSKLGMCCISCKNIITLLCGCGCHHDDHQEKKQKGRVKSAISKIGLNLGNESVKTPAELINSAVQDQNNGRNILNFNLFKKSRAGVSLFETDILLAEQSSELPKSDPWEEIASLDRMKPNSVKIRLVNQLRSHIQDGNGAELTVSCLCILRMYKLKWSYSANEDLIQDSIRAAFALIASQEKNVVREAAQFLVSLVNSNQRESLRIVMGKSVERESLEKVHKEASQIASADTLRQFMMRLYTSKQYHFLEDIARWIRMSFRELEALHTLLIDIRKRRAADKQEGDNIDIAAAIGSPRTQDIRTEHKKLMRKNLDTIKQKEGDDIIRRYDPAFMETLFLLLQTIFSMDDVQLNDEFVNDEDPRYGAVAYYERLIEKTQEATHESILEYIRGTRLGTYSNGAGDDKSHNIIQFTTKYLKKLLLVVRPENVDLLIGVLSCLASFVEGSTGNQTVLLNENIHTAINDILHRKYVSEDMNNPKDIKRITTFLLELCVRLVETNPNCERTRSLAAKLEFEKSSASVTQEKTVTTKNIGSIIGGEKEYVFTEFFRDYAPPHQNAGFFLSKIGRLEQMAKQRERMYNEAYVFSEDTRLPILFYTLIKILYESDPTSEKYRRLSLELFSRDKRLLDIGHIEVLDQNSKSDSEIKSVYFPIPGVCENLNEDKSRKDDSFNRLENIFVYDHPYDQLWERATERILVFLKWSESNLIELESFQKFRNPLSDTAKGRITYALSQSQAVLSVPAYILVVCLNLLVLFFFDENRAYSDRANEWLYYKNNFRYPMMLLGIIHSVLAFLMLVSWLILHAGPANFNKWSAWLVTGSHWRSLTTIDIFRMKNLLKTEPQRRKIARQRLRANPIFGRYRLASLRYIFWSIIHILTDWTIAYHIGYFICSCLALTWFPYFYAYNLYYVFIWSPQLRELFRVMKIVIFRLLLMGYLLIPTVLVFSVFGKLLFSTLYEPSNNAYCDTVLQCFVTNLQLGVPQNGALIQKLPQASWNEVDQSGVNVDPTNNSDWQIWGLLMYYFLFWICVGVILLNMILALIVDTFGQLRDQQSEFWNALTNGCFICTISRERFQQHGGRLMFRKHIHKDHNLWQYLYFFVYLKQKRKFITMEKQREEKRRAGDGNGNSNNEGEGGIGIEEEGGKNSGSEYKIRGELRFTPAEREIYHKIESGEDMLSFFPIKRSQALEEEDVEMSGDEEESEEEDEGMGRKKRKEEDGVGKKDMKEKAEITSAWPLASARYMKVGA